MILIETTHGFKWDHTWFPDQGIAGTGCSFLVIFCIQIHIFHYLFVIEYKNKSSKQIKNTTEAYLVLDDIENGVFNQTPLWLFGFLY